MINICNFLPIIFSIFKDREINVTNMESDKEVISRLKFISRINGGEKINVRYMFVQQDDIATKISRTLYYKDNRRNALSFIKNTIKRSFEIIKFYKNSNKDRPSRGREGKRRKARRDVQDRMH